MNYIFPTDFKRN